MIPALYSASSGMQAQQLNLDTIANNLANVNTTGFKKTRVDFQDLLYQTLRTPGLAGTQGTIIPTGIQSASVRARSRPSGSSPRRLPADGRPSRSRGPGRRLLPGLALRRHHRVNARGRLQEGRHRAVVTSDGAVLTPNIVGPGDAKNLTIGSDGTVSATLAGSTSGTTLGQIQIASS